MRTRMSVCGQEALPDVLGWSGVPPGCPGVVGMPFLMSGCSRKVLPDIQEWSGVPPGCPGLVGMPSRRTVSG